MGLRKVVIGSALTVFLLAGCSDKEPGSPSAAPTGGSSGTDSPADPTTTSSRPSGSNGASAPKVSDPLDANRFLAEPCSAITPSQLQTLRVPAQGEARTAAVGPGCSWFDRNAGSGLELGFLNSNKNGLSDTYLGNEQGRFKGYFEPTEVDGYPAVFNDLRDYRNDGVCNITVGISDTLAFRTAVTESALGSKSCDKARQAAAAVITTVKGA